MWTKINKKVWANDCKYVPLTFIESRGRTREEREERKRKKEFGLVLTKTKPNEIEKREKRRAEGIVLSALLQSLLSAVTPHGVAAILLFQERWE